MNGEAIHEDRNTKKTGMVWIWFEEGCEEDYFSFRHVVIKMPIYERCLSLLTPSISFSNALPLLTQDP